MCFEIAGAPGTSTALSRMIVAAYAGEALVIKYRIHYATKQFMTYLQHYDVTWCVANGILNEDDHGNLNDKHDKFHLKCEVDVFSVSIQRPLIWGTDGEKKLS